MALNCDKYVSMRSMFIWLVVERILPRQQREIKRTLIVHEVVIELLERNIEGRIVRFHAELIVRVGGIRLHDADRDDAVSCCPYPCSYTTNSLPEIALQINDELLRDDPPRIPRLRDSDPEGARRSLSRVYRDPIRTGSSPDTVISLFSLSDASARQNPERLRAPRDDIGLHAEAHALRSSRHVAVRLLNERMSRLEVAPARYGPSSARTRPG